MYLLIYTCLLLICASTTLGQNAPEHFNKPETMKKPVENMYHGTTVIDDYQWLEDYDNPDVKEWTNQQNVLTREYLDNISDWKAIRNRFDEIFQSDAIEYYYLKVNNGKIFALKKQPPLEAPMLVMLTDINDLSSEKVILDLNELDPEGHTSIDFYVPSPTGRLIAVALSKYGSELGDLSILDITNGQRLPEVVPYVNGPTAGGDVAWLCNDTGFFYTRYPRPGDEHDDDPSFYQQVYYHKLGTDTKEDKYIIGKEFPRIAEIEFEQSHDNKHFIVTVANGDGGKYAHYLLNEQLEVQQLTQFEDHIPTVEFGEDNNLYLKSYKNSPNGKLLRLSVSQPELSVAEEIVPEQKYAIKSYVASKTTLFVTYLAGGPNELYIYPLDNLSDHKTVPLPEYASIYGMQMMDDKLLFRLSTYTEPSGYYLFDSYNGTVSKTEIFITSSVNFNDIEVRREYAVSKDGTKVPVNILMKKGTDVDGQNPTLLYGYGGYGISLQPYFDASMRLWFDQGGIYAIANLRGGGEFGEAWHLDGNLTKKQNVFDDFTACAEHLIKNNYTSVEKLAIKGGSNGGLLMGAVVTQRPDLYRAVIANVGVFDMLRVELDANGEFNITEYGTVKDPDQFKALHAYSPYHNVEAATAYPGMLLTTGAYDGRVNPAHSRKMTAAIQTATTSGYPVLLRTNFTAGHSRGATLTEKINLNTDMFTFILDQMGLRFKND